MYTLCSGFVIDKYINPKSFLYKFKRKNEIKKILSKRNDIPDNIKKALIEMPQYEIFFEGFTPYYRENNSPEKKKNYLWKKVCITIRLNAQRRIN